MSFSLCLTITHSANNQTLSWISNSSTYLCLKLRAHMTFQILSCERTSRRFHCWVLKSQWHNYIISIKESIVKQQWQQHFTEIVNKFTASVEQDSMAMCCSKHYRHTRSSSSIWEVRQHWLMKVITQRQDTKRKRLYTYVLYMLCYLAQLQCYIWHM